MSVCESEHSEGTQSEGTIPLNHGGPDYVSRNCVIQPELDMWVSRRWYNGKGLPEGWSPALGSTSSSVGEAFSFSLLNKGPESFFLVLRLGALSGPFILCFLGGMCQAAGVHSYFSH